MTTNNDMMAAVADLLVKAMVERLLNDETFIGNIVDKVSDRFDSKLKDFDEQHLNERISEELRDFTVKADDIDGLDEAIENAVGNIEVGDLTGFENAVEEVIGEYKFNADQIEDLDEAVCKAVSEKLSG